MKRSLLPKERGCRIGVGGDVRAGLLSEWDRGEAEVEGSMVKSMGRCRNLRKCMVLVWVEFFLGYSRSHLSHFLEIAFKADLAV